MVPLQYILKAADLAAAQQAGCHWVQLSDSAGMGADEVAFLLAQSHAAGSYLVLTDNVDACCAAAADGVVLTPAGISATVARLPEPSGIVLQRPLPVTQAIGEARRTLGEESPQFVGVVAETPADAVAAAKAGADFIQVPQALCTTLLQAVRERSFTTPIVALGTFAPEEVPALLDAGISGVACSIDDVPPVMIPLLLTADEQ